MGSPATDEPIPEPLRTVLRDYLHVEWYELDELAQDVMQPNWNEKLPGFKAQLRYVIATGNISVSAVQSLTGHEFENKQQLVGWLSDIWSTLYGEPL